MNGARLDTRIFHVSGLIHAKTSPGTNVPEAGKNEFAAGVPEMVTNEYNGFLFEPGDEVSLSRIIEMLINNKETLAKLSGNAIESSRKFPMENQMKSTLEAYARILSH